MNLLQHRKLLFYATTGALGGFLFGFDVAIIAGAMPFFQTYFELSTMELGLVNSSLLFGCILGSLFAGRLADQYGRRNLLVVVAILFSTTSIGCSLAPSVSILVVSRFLGGLAVGAVSVASPMYIAEIAPPLVRGRLLTLYQLSITAGILVSLSTNYLLKDFAYNWRLMFASGIIPSFIFTIMLFLIPETPRFLVKKGRTDQAEQVLRKIGNGMNIVHVIQEIQSSFGQGKERIADLNKPGVRKAVFVSFILAFLIQASGIAAIIDYAPRILQRSGMNIDSALLNTLGIGLINFLFTIVSIFTIDRLGRKPLYLIGSAGTLFALIALFILFFGQEHNGVAVFVACVIYIVFFAATLGPVFWTLLPEMLPNKIRGIGMTVPVLTQWFINALVVMIFPVVFEKNAGLPFLFMAVMSAIQFYVILKFVPETKSKSLEEIESLWLQNHT